MRNRERQFKPEFSNPGEELPEETVGEEKEPEKDPEQEFLRNRINRVDGIFRVFKYIENEIRRHHLDPLLTIDHSDEYIKGLIPTDLPENQELNETDLHRAENRNIALAIEIAGQILQHKTEERDVREDPKLLEQLCLTLRKAGLMFMNMQKQRPKEAEDLLKTILVERKGITEDSIKPEKIGELAKSISSAHDFIQLKQKILSRYSKK